MLEELDFTYWSSLEPGDTVVIGCGECDCGHEFRHPAVKLTYVTSNNGTRIVIGDHEYETEYGYRLDKFGQSMWGILDPSESLDAEYALTAWELEIVRTELLLGSPEDRAVLLYKESSLDNRLDRLSEQVIDR